MNASEPTAFTLDRTERFSCNALQEELNSPAQTMPNGGATLMSLSFRRSVPMLPIECTTLIPFNASKRNSPLQPRHHATHN
jgi:hypothetical protein